jgi:hypothetical protein
VERAQPVLRPAGPGAGNLQRSAAPFQNAVRNRDLT